MALFLDGTCAKRGPKRKVRECLLCCMDTLDPVICPAHSQDSCYCLHCIAKMWIDNGRKIPQCEECDKRVPNGIVRASLNRYDDVHRTDFVTRFDQHQIFLYGDAELPVEGYCKKVCVCHDPPCKGTTTFSGNWVTFRPGFKVPKTSWITDKGCYTVIPGKRVQHPPICARCFAPAPPGQIDLGAPCGVCASQSTQAVTFAPLHHYINPLAGAKGQWTMPLRVHQVSTYNLMLHMYWILEDPNLFVRCPVDGTILEHGVDCHELSCFTCKMTKICFVCGHAKITGADGALIDHYGANPNHHCCRYPDMYRWRVAHTDGTTTQIPCPCSAECTTVEWRCDVEDHQTWRSYYTEWRRMCWLVAFLREIPGNHFLVQIGMKHLNVTRSKFVHIFTNYVNSI